MEAKLKTYKTLFRITASLLAVVIIVQILFGTGVFKIRKNDSSPEQQVLTETLSREGYTLKQVVILSRHNIRSPLSGKDSALGSITPHEWFAWTSDPSELSTRGGVLETEMGQYFRKWLEDEGLFPENYQPSEEEVRIYANSKQRTIATARYFSAGLLPSGETDVEYHMDFDQMDPVFFPQLTLMNDEYRESAESQIHELFDEEIYDLEDNYKLISEVIDLEDSEGFKNGTAEPFRTDDTQIILEEGQEPCVSGSLKTACSVSDALVLQYYEEPDPLAAAFGEELSYDQWQDISEVKDLYGEVLFTAPLIAYNVAHPLLMEIESELSDEDRIFTFLCGHDSNLGSVLSALDVEDYSLDRSIEEKTPIGAKLVFARWEDAQGKEYISLDLVYQTSGQLQDMELLDLSDQPMIFSVTLRGLSRNIDGLYQADEFMAHIRSAVEEYDIIRQEYGIDMDNNM